MWLCYVNFCRGKDVSDIAVHFPALAADLKVPKVFPKEAFFSSVFRITSPNLQLWTHYDTCDNILIQIRGRKRIVFYPPTEALNLYLDGDKSEIVDIDSPDFTRYPKFKDVEQFEVILEEGDIVFIPALWFHNITALDFSISVNVFWKNLVGELYDKKDPYGNKDLIPAQLVSCIIAVDLLHYYQTLAASTVSISIFTSSKHNLWFCTISGLQDFRKNYQSATYTPISIPGFLFTSNDSKTRKAD